MARLLISSRNYSSWSLRGFLLVRLSGLPCAVEAVGAEDPEARRELLLRASSIRIPRLEHDRLIVWDTLAIAEYLNETFPPAAMLPADRAARAHARSLCGEMHAGFTALRGSLPMNVRAHRPGFPVWSGARSDIDRISEMWRDCLQTHGGPWLFGDRPTIADAMFAPAATRMLTYDVALDPLCAAYCRQIMTWPDMAEWVAAALVEPEEIEELEVEC